MGRTQNWQMLGNASSKGVSVGDGRICATDQQIPFSSLLFTGIPTLILLDTEGRMITRQGRVEVLNDPECRLFPWHPRPVLELSESNAVQLHEGPCLVLFVGELTPD